MVGGEESVPTVQHARLAARPAGRQHGSPCANTAAFAWHREPGVADSSPLTLQYRHTQTHIPTRSPVQVHFSMSLWTDWRNWSSCADIYKNCASAAIVTSLYLCIGSHEDLLISALTDDQPFPCLFCFLFTDNEEKLI